eukprot:TRINITY_DN0_c2_g1_i1.p1 TRINITY_DN0_c2_g1~~TRINITY_DN0_c2_g1_i1.p1  ORF type:complete len:357 (+),score=53.89 TRINITY_DN0_c2_g1_i1:101-1171(+)
MTGVDTQLLAYLLSLWRLTEFFWSGMFISFYDKYFTGRYSFTWSTPMASRPDPLKKKQYTIITGSNTGLGFELARQILASGESVILACRSEERGSAAAKRLEEEKDANWGDVKFIRCDLSDFDSIRAFVSNTCDYLSSVNCYATRIICNAAVMACPFGTTKQGYEMQFGCNHLGHALLTELFIKHFKSTPSPTNREIIMVASATASSGKHTAEDYSVCGKQSESTYNTYQQYPSSKLAMICYTNGLADELRSYNESNPTGGKIFINSIHPGCLATSIGRDLPFMNAMVAWVSSKTLIISASEGASFITRLCYDPTLTNISGKFFYMTAEADPPAPCLDSSIVSDVMQKTRSAVLSL